MEKEYLIKPCADVFQRLGLNSENNQALKKITLDQVRVNPSIKTIYLDITAKTQLTDKVQNEIINSIISKNIGVEKVKINVKVVETADTSNIDIKNKTEIEKNDKSINLKEYICDNWQNIIAEIKEEYPSANGLFNACNFEFDDELSILTIELKTEISIKLAKENKLDEFIRNYILENCNKQIFVNFCKGSGAVELFEEFNKDVEKTVEVEIENIKKQFSEDSPLILGEEIKKPVNSTIEKLKKEEDGVILAGEVLNVSSRECQIFDGKQKTTKTLNKFILADDTSAIECIYYGTRALRLKDGDYIKLKGRVRYNRESELTIRPYAINRIEKEYRMDTCEFGKRIELHLHSNMSKMDALINIDELIKNLKRWGHSACAVTDHGTAHIFPDFYKACVKNNIKPILGVEGYLVDTVTAIFSNFDENKVYEFDSEKVFIQLLCDDYSHSEIYGLKYSIEKSGVRSKPNEIYFTQNFQIAGEGKKYSCAENKTLEDKPTISKKLSELFKSRVIIGYDICLQLKKLEIYLETKFDNPLFDIRQIGLLKINDKEKLKNTLPIRELVEYYKLTDEINIFNLDISLLIKLFDCIIDEYKKTGINNFNDFIKFHKTDEEVRKVKGANHIVFLVKNQIGLKNLYKLISMANLRFSYHTPKLPRSEIIKHKEGLIFGSACESSDVYQAVLHNSKDEKIIENIRFYDYIELQPVENNKFFIEEYQNLGINSLDDIRELNKRLLKLCQKMNKLVVATSDAHFLEPSQSLYRLILQHSIGMKEKRETVNLCLKTTNEMLDEFSYLSKEDRKAIVIDNPQKIVDMIEIVKPVPDGFYPPEIENADEKLKDIVMTNAHRIYGDNLPEIVKKRIDKELNSIITNKFSNLYLLAHNVVQKAKNDGIIVGSRGSVGSSIVAFFAGITDVNALPPHYVCANCKLSMFDAPAEIETGFDLPDKKCPNCGEQLNKDGHNIFFEVFLGFEGDKVPDIDLNFPGYYQPIIHKYVEELFGANNVYRAGTISKVSDGIAKIIVNKFAEERQINWTAAEKLRIAKGCCEVKKTTGQHPGGIIIVPKSKEIYDFCPIQYPSDENSEEVITTHFDYHKMEEQLVKLDLLGHDNPAQLLLLREYTGFDFNDIPYNDEKTLQLFSSVKSIGVSEEELGASVATFAIPEFGTDFVRGMLEDTRPKNIGDLIRICGLAHGTNVWQGNAQELIRKKITNLNGVISARDNIMLDLINKGMDAQKAFKIMEKVRKGKGLNDDEIKLMIEHKVAKWYIDSCRKIEYLFPKAHAVAYTILSYKIAYYKIHYPMEFYASYFTIKATDLNLEHLLLDVKSIKKLLDEYYDKKRRNELTTKEYTEISILEVIKEAKLRNIEIMNVDIEKSETFKSLVIDKKILPPLVSIEGLGSKVAENIVAERKKQGFRTIKELCERCKINKKVLEALKKFNCFGDLPETEQYSLF